MIKPKLTIGMVVHDDYDGCCFTVQSLVLHNSGHNYEIIVVDNYGCDVTKDFCDKTGVRYIRDTSCVGTAAPRDRIFTEASSDYVLVCDCHVLFYTGAIDELLSYYDKNPESNDIIHGPIVFDNCITVKTHMDPVWNDKMFGVWGFDPKFADNVPFEIPMHGLGIFSMRKAAWPGFNSLFKGFGGEEGYIHEKVRKRGGKAMCLPGLKWWHRFGRVNRPTYPNNLTDRLFNYIVGARELGIDETDAIKHFTSVGVDALPAIVAANKAIPLSAAKNAWPLVSCVCMTYNRFPAHGYLLNELVESFSRQAYPNKELIIVNDVPQHDIVCDVEGVTCINIKDRTFTNIGEKFRFAVAQAKGDYICRWDDDDIYLPNHISNCIHRLGERKAVWIPTNYMYLNNDLSISGDTASNKTLAGIFHKSVLEKIGGFPTDYSETTGEDYLFEHRAKDAGLLFSDDIPTSEQTFIYRWNSGAPHTSAMVNGNLLASIARFQNQQKTGGEYQIRPKWHNDYLRMHRQLICKNSQHADMTKIPGWFDFSLIYDDAVNLAEEGDTLIELGSWRGKSAAHMAKRISECGKHLKFFAIDNCVGGIGYRDTAHNYASSLLQNLIDTGLKEYVTVMIDDSTSAANHFEDGSLHFVFIDAGHTFEEAYSDIAAWWPKIKPGGIIAGHDYTYDYAYSVIRAVDEFFRPKGLDVETVPSSSWRIRKPK